MGIRIVAGLLLTLVIGGSAGAEEPLSLIWRDKEDRQLRAARDALLPSRPPYQNADADADDARFRVEVSGTPRPRSVRMSLVSIDPVTGRVRDRIHLGTGELEQGDGAVRTPWLVLAADDDDRYSPRLRGRALKAALGDRIEARVRVGGRRARRWSMPVGRPAYERSAAAVRPVRLSFTMLRDPPGGAPLVGGTDGSVRELMAYQAQVAGEVLAQCAVTVSMDEIGVRVADPPGPCLLAVGERFGLPSSGGHVRLMVDGRRLGPWKVGGEYTPAQTARLLGRHLEDAGFRVERYDNARVSSFAHATADLLVRRADGTPARLGPWPGEPLSTDASQSLDIGAVDLSDGIDAYDDLTADSGSLEERTLLRALSDGHPETIDVIVVNRFTSPRQGESFLPSGTAAAGGAVVLDINALARARQSYTLSHELGHVLLDDLGHPDDNGEEDTSLLMHSRSSSALDGPKRIPEAECDRIRDTIERHFFEVPSPERIELWRR